MSELYVITPVFNPAGYLSRYALYHEFSRRIAQGGARLVTIELALGEQPFAVTCPDNPLHIQVRAASAIWSKENLINIALTQLPKDWQFAAWVDCDIAFARADWVDQTIAGLKKHAFIQMFSHAIDLGPHFEPLMVYEGYAHRHHRKPKSAPGTPGYAWAARRDALEAVGGLLDVCILGSADHFMARAMLGRLRPHTTRMPGTTYAQRILQWQQRLIASVGAGFGHVETTILHHWHGKRIDRGYAHRWRILVEHDFDPSTDLKANADGVLELAGNKPALQQAILAYFRTRREDAVEV